MNELSGAIDAQNAETSAENPLAIHGVLTKQIVEKAISAWPDFNVDRDAFAKRVLDLLDPLLPAEEAVRQIAVGDLFLAYACSLGDCTALNAFAQQCDGELRAVARKLRLSEADFDESRQVLWNKLFVGSQSGPPKILDYRGEGQIRQWFRVVAGRGVLNELRRWRRPTPDGIEAIDNEFGAALGDDPELTSIRRRFKAAFRASFGRAVTDLDPRERNLLRCHYVLGMSTDQMAGTFGTHKATAARHVAKARERLLKHTRSYLKNVIGSSGELESAMRFFDGELTISLSKLLR